MIAKPLFQGSVLTKPLGPNRVVIADQNDYAGKLARQALRTQSTTPPGYYALGYQTITVDYTSSVPIYWVPQGAPTYPVVWKTGNPLAPASMQAQSGLQTYFQRVPLPVERGANLAAAGNDKACVIIEEGTYRMWEFWELSFDPVALQGTCLFGGYIPNASRHSGILAWGWGTSASGIALPLMNRMAEFVDGAFAHPLRLQVPDTTGTHIFPAVRNDGGGPKAANPSGSAVDQVPEGLWIDLPPSYVPPAGLNAAQTMTQIQVRDFGAIVADATGGPVNLVFEDHHTQGTGYCEVPNLQTVTYPTPGFWDTAGANGSGAANPWNNFPWQLIRQVAPPQ